jgi:hypothetical protein
MISHLVGISRSAFLSAVLVKSLPLVRDATIEACRTTEKLNAVDGIDAGEAVRRYRATSKAIIDDFLASLDGELQRDLFTRK